MRAAFLLVPLTLAGCQSVQPMTDAERRADHTSRCEMMGAKTKDQMFQCRLALEQAHQQSAPLRDEMARQRRASAMQNFGNTILMNQAAQQAYRPSTTTCNQYGNRVVCNSF